MSLLAALLAAFCYGLGAVMQAIAVRASSRRPMLAAAGGSGGRVDPGMFIRLLRQWPFLASLVIDLIGFIGQLVALRRLPLFEVQVIIAANLAVTAVFASWLMHTVLRWREWAAVIAVVIGVGLLGSSAGAEGAAKVGVDFHLALLAALAAIAVAGVAAARLPNPIRTPVLGAFAGLGYGVLAVCARILPGFSVHLLIRSPSAYTLIAAAIVSFMLYASALEGGSVTTATAAVILLETIPPALVGVMLLGDSTRPGMTPVAVAGFIIALVSAIALARFGEGASEDAAGSAGPAGTRASGARASGARASDARATGDRAADGHAADGRPADDDDSADDDGPTAPQSAVPGGHRAAEGTGQEAAGPGQVLTSGQRRQLPR